MNVKELQQKVNYALTLRKKNRRTDDTLWNGIAIRGVLDQEESFSFSSGHLNFSAHPVKSILEMRNLLQESEKSQVKKVFMIDFEARDFPNDIKARLLKGTLQDIDTWEMILSRFDARRFDKKITNNEEVLNALLQFEPLKGYEKSPAGYLSYDHFWSCISREVLKFEREMSDSVQLLKWALETSNAQLFMDLHPDVQQQIYRWLDTQNAFVSLILKCTVARLGAELIPLGLVSVILFSSSLADEKSITRAQVKFEQKLNLNDLPLSLQREWASASKDVLQIVSDELRERLLNKADQWVNEFGVKEFASESDVLFSGFSQRIVNFSKQCELYMKGQASHDNLTESLELVLLHNKCQSDPERATRMQMLVRLMRWLKTDSFESDDFETLSQFYRTNLSYVDFARGVIAGGDSIPQLQDIYSIVSSQCLERRECFNKVYAKAAVTHRWKSNQNSMLKGVESVLDDVVTPLAENHKCLVLVMDGMSWAVANELIPDFDGSHWTLRSSDEWKNDQLSVISTVPSVTEHGRMSLLSGKLAKGHQQDEKHTFAEHSGLKKMVGSGYPPVLFHKGELENVGRTGLTQNVRRTIENPRHKVVGLVINSIDDHLAKDDMKLHRWKLNNIRVLDSILESAKNSKRVIIMCSDHGHIEATWTKCTQSVDGGERWQPDVKDMTGCIKVDQPHSAYKEGLVACWSEQRSFGVKKNGYHGGVSPQELMAPCVVMAQMGEDVKGWNETRLSSPEWWISEGSDSSNAQITFESNIPTLEQSEVVVDWVSSLMASKIFEGSCKQAGRRRPKDEQIQTLLTELEHANANQVSVSELGRALEIPDGRMRGLMAQVSKIFNLEGYQIIEYTTDGRHIRLNKDLLFQQFGLE